MRTRTFLYYLFMTVIALVLMIGAIFLYQEVRADSTSPSCGYVLTYASLYDSSNQATGIYIQSLSGSPGTASFYWVNTKTRISGPTKISNLSINNTHLTLNGSGTWNNQAVTFEFDITRNSTSLPKGSAGIRVLQAGKVVYSTGNNANGTVKEIPLYTSQISWLYTPALCVNNNPPKISNISVTNITSSSAVVNWTTDKVTNSKLEWGTTTAYGTSYSVKDNSTKHSMGIPGTVKYTMKPSTIYHFRITATDSSGKSTSSADQTFKTSPPKNSSAPGVEEVASADNTLKEVSGVSASSGDNSSETQMYLAGTSAGSGAAPLSQTSSDISAPKNLTYSLSQAQLTLTWQASDSVVDGYNIYRAVDGNFVNIGKTQKDVLIFLDGNVSMGTTYDYFVRAYKGASESASSNTISATISDTNIVSSSSPGSVSSASQPNQNRKYFLVTLVTIFGILFILGIAFRKKLIHGFHNHN